MSQWRAVVSMVAVLLSASTGLAETLTYQGQLNNVNGEAVTASYGVVFTLYDAANDGASLWSESHDSVDIVDGQFTVQLGSITPIDAVALGGGDLFLSVRVDGGDELLPRMQVGSALRARWAATADHATDVRDEHIHPRSVSIGTTPVIDENGAWVGDTVGLRGPEGPTGPPGPIGPAFDLAQDTDTDGVPDWIEIAVGSDATDMTDMPLMGDDGVADLLQVEGPEGPRGPAGASIASAVINFDGDLIMTFTDSTTINVGRVLGPQGPEGDTGAEGPQGAEGATVENVQIDETGALKLFMNDGRLLTAAGTARGPEGPKGDEGDQGPQGNDGADGTSVLQATVDNEGNLIVGLTDGSSLNAGSVIGPQGPAGQASDPAAVAAALGGDLTFSDSVATSLVTNHSQALSDALGGVVAGGPEGSGVVSRISNQWVLPAFGTAREYIHLLNPSMPKVLMYLYGEEPTGSAYSNSLQVTSTYSPNGSAGGLFGNAGEAFITTANAGIFNVGDHLLLHQTVHPTEAGKWELGVVTSITGGQVNLAQPLQNSYESNGNFTSYAQVVVAASFDTLDVLSGGEIRPPQGLDHDNAPDFKGGIVYLRARELIVRAGGKIHADGGDPSISAENQTYISGWGGYAGSDNAVDPGSSYCSSNTNSGNSGANNCNAGGGGSGNTGTCNNNRYNGGGGGGNKEPGEKPNYPGTNSYVMPTQGGAVWGDENDGLLKMGGGGGASRRGYDGGRGGGIVVIGADIVTVQAGGVISVNGGDGQSYSNSTCSYSGGGGGAGGTVAIFANQIVNEGTIEAEGGSGGSNSNNTNRGGDGGAGYILSNQPIPGVVAQTYANGIEIWVDNQNVTAQIGDPNGKGAPNYNAANNTWGVGGTARWSSGPLDISSVTNWTLGEHMVEFKDTGGAGGDVKAYFYVIQTFSESTPPLNNQCVGAEVLDVGVAGPKTTVSGTTEDFMGKNLATDDHNAAGCAAVGGPDAVYKIELTERSLIHARVQAPFDAKLIVRKADCANGEVVYCGDAALDTNPLEPGSYYIWVDSEAANAKGNFTLEAWRTAAVLPGNDTCDSAQELIFGEASSVTVQATSIYSLDQYFANFCHNPDPGAAEGGPDLVYKFTAPTGDPINITMSSEFTGKMYLTKGSCADENGIILNDFQSCSTTVGETESITVDTQAGGEYYLFIEGVGEKQWGNFEFTVSFE